LIKLRQPRLAKPQVYALKVLGLSFRDLENFRASKFQVPPSFSPMPLHSPLGSSFDGM
jgi:hypothetical protein